jgi:hypothetical protein
MAMTRRIGRWVLFAAAIALAALVVFFFAVRAYISSGAGRELVARKIENAIGMPVTVQSLSVGLNSSSVSLQVFDPALSRGNSEVLAVDSATVNISLFHLMTGDIDPSSVDVRGLTLILRVDAKGQLLTTLPRMEGGGSSLPHIALSNGRLTVHQDGRPEFDLRNIDLTAEPQGQGNVHVTGSINDPDWSKWTVSGDLNRLADTGSLALATNDGPLTLERLTSIPFLPESIWKHVQPDGRGACSLTVAQNADQHTTYDVSIRPAAAALAIPDAEVTLNQVTGLIRYVGAKLELQGTHASLAGGQIGINGVVDFEKKQTVADLKVTASGLNLQELPESWGLPRDIQGDLEGNANLQVVVHADGRIEPRGGGSGRIAHAKIRDIPVSISLKLASNGKRYQFENTDHKTTPGLKSSRDSTRDIHLAFHRMVIQCAGQPPKEAPRKAPEQPKTTEQPKAAASPMLTATVRLKDVEISQLLEKLNLKLGYTIRGKVSAEVDLGVSLDRKQTQSSYRFSGRLTSAALQLEGLVIHDLSAGVLFENGKLSLTELAGKIDQPGQPTAAPGAFLGTASVQINPPGDARANFSFQHIPLGEILRAAPQWSIEVRGQSDGKAEFRAPYEHLSDPKTWVASADFNAPELILVGRTVQGLHIGLEVKEGTAKLKNTKVSIEGIPMTAEASIDLAGKYPFTATVRTTATKAADLRKLAPEITLPRIEGVLDTETRVSGTASPFDSTATGRISAVNLTLGNRNANRVELNWKATTEKLVVSDFTATVFGGVITGSADLPYSSDRGGKFDVAFKEVNAQEATAFVPDFPIQIDGKISGKVSGTIVPARPGQSRVGNMDVDLSAPKLTVQGIPADRLVGKATIINGGIDYKVEGKTLGGSFDLKGRYPVSQPRNPAQAPRGERGSFRITGVDLARIAPEMNQPNVSPLRGRFDLTIDFDEDLSKGSGRVTFANLGWGTTNISQELRGVLVLQDGAIRLTELTGRVAGGELAAMAQVSLSSKHRNYFAVNLRDADAKRLLALVPEIAQKVDGPISIRANGQFSASEIRGTGTLSQYGGNISGVPVSNLNLPFEWAIGAGGLGRFNVRSATLNAGNGRLVADLSVRWGYDVAVSGQVRFIEVPMRAFLPSSSSLFGNGRISGRFVLGGNSVRSVDDLTGNLFATFTQTSVREVPILRQVIPFLNTAGLGGQPFQSGDIRATLAKGVFNVQRLALVNSNSQVFADGSITLTGKLNVAVVAHIGLLGPAGTAFVLFGSKLPMVGPIPLSLIAEITAFLSNRTVKLSITGTTKDPVVRVNTSALLTEEAVRFLLGRYVLPGNAADALGLGFEGSFGK